MLKYDKDAQTTFNTWIIKVGVSKSKSKAPLSETIYMTFKSFCGHLEAVCYHLFSQLQNSFAHPVTGISSI